jgi:hypothetical protein
VKKIKRRKQKTRASVNIHTCITGLKSYIPINGKNENAISTDSAPVCRATTTLSDPSGPKGPKKKSADMTANPWDPLSNRQHTGDTLGNHMQLQRTESGLLSVYKDPGLRSITEVEDLFTQDGKTKIDRKGRTKWFSLLRKRTFLQGKELPTTKLI